MYEEKNFIQLVLRKANSLLGRRYCRRLPLKRMQNWTAYNIFSHEVTSGQNESCKGQEFIEPWQM